MGRLPRRLEIAMALMVVVMALGTFGFMVIEDMAVIDAVYMTLITVSTVGFAEVGGPLSTAGRVLAMGLIVFGVGALLYTASLAFEFSVETLLMGRREERRLHSRIDSLTDHIIVCGFGRVGRDVWDILRHTDADVVVIDGQEEIVEEAIDDGAMAMLGDATRDEVLLAAGIAKAKTLICAVRSDSENLVIALSGRALRKDIFIVARALEIEAEKKLYLAGADRVVAPQVVGAQRIAALAVESDVAEFIDFMVKGRLVEMRIEEIDVSSGSAVAGKSLRELDLRSRSGALVLAIVSSGGRMSFNPDPTVAIKAGQGVVAIGSSEQLDRLRTIALGDVPAHPSH